MLTAATMIYAVGPGTQEVGSAIFGPWFGKLYAGISEVMAPVTQAFDQLGSTFGNAFQMLVNPVGFAQGIMQGTYTKDTDTGLIGAFGVEMGNFRATPIYTNQSFTVIVPIQNKGSAKATNIEVSLMAGTGVEKSKEGKVKNLPTKETGWWKPFNPKNEVLRAATAPIQGPAVWEALEGTTTITMSQIGIKEDMLDETGEYTCNDKRCYTEVRDLTKLDSEQVFFTSTGIPCTSIVNFGLLTHTKSKFLPFTAITSYDYSVESSLEIEAISEEEWTRLAQEGMLYPSIKKPSSMANSPVMLNIDTLEQPIREGTPFFIAFNLTPAIPSKAWLEWAEVTLELPKEMVENNNLARCTTEPAKNEVSGNAATLVWNKRTGAGQSGTYPVGTNAIYCYFNRMPVSTGPTETYYVRANATFRINDMNTKAFAFEFGGTRCCDPNAQDPGCPGENNPCNPQTFTCAGIGTGIPTTGCGSDPNALGGANFCTDSDPCEWGYGGCQQNSNCKQEPFAEGPGISRNVTCMSVPGTTVNTKICCQEGNEEQCKTKFNDLCSGLS